MEDKTDLQGLVLIVAAPTTLLFAIEGFYAAYNYDGFLTTLVRTRSMLRTLLILFEVLILPHYSYNCLHMGGS